MKPTLLFRLGAITLLLQATGHTLGGVIFYHAHNAAEAAVIDAMRSSRVEVQGVVRSLWDFYYGWGLAVGALSYALAGIAWALGSLSLNPHAKTGQFTFWTVVGCILQIGLCMRYFFALPVMLLSLAALFCAAGWWRHRRASLENPFPLPA